MNLPEVVVDTDILSALMRGNPLVVANAELYLAQYGRLSFSLITRYEVLRGLKVKDAKKQVAAFEEFCANNTILSLTDEVISQASGIYADLHKRGELIGDADILIAATALVNGLGVVTNNERHFRRVTNLHIENWQK
jgi:tRNA(fMet)-specific endonuclease VapC